MRLEAGSPLGVFLLLSDPALLLDLSPELSEEFLGRGDGSLDHLRIDLQGLREPRQSPSALLAEGVDPPGRFEGISERTETEAQAFTVDTELHPFGSGSGRQEEFELARRGPPRSGGWRVRYVCRSTRPHPAFAGDHLPRNGRLVRTRQRLVLMQW